MFSTIRRKPWFVSVALVAVVIFIAACSAATYLLGLSTGRASRAIKLVTASDAGVAMASDDFYSLYGDSTLLVTGRVASVRSTADGTIVNFATTSRFGASCELRATGYTFSPGARVTLVTQADAARRDPSSVFLSDCVIP